MAARLGNVIYWLGLAIAILAGLVAAFMFYNWYARGPIAGPPINDAEAVRSAEAFMDYLLKMTFAAAGVSFGSWLVGRVARYILAGR